MSLLEIVLLSLLAAGLVTYITMAIVKTIKRKRHQKEDEDE